MTEIELRYTLTVDEAVSAMRSRLTRSWSMRLSLLIVILFALITVPLNLASGDASSVIFAIAPFILVIGLFIFFYYSPFTRTQMRKEARFYIEQTWRFNEEGATHRTEHGESRNAWTAYLKAGETSRFFFLFLVRNIVAPIPKRAFANAEQQAQFRDLLKRKLRLESM